MEKLTVFNCSKLSDCCHQRPQEVTVDLAVKERHLIKTEVFFVHVVDLDLDKVMLVLSGGSAHPKPLTLLLAYTVQKLGV